MIILILSLIVIGAGMLIYSLGIDNVSKVRSLTWNSAVLVTVGVCFGINYNNFKTEPTALDVYQGKTNLEYTIRDGEIVDSVVVFKNK